MTEPTDPQERGSPLREPEATPVNPTLEQIARGAEIMRGLKEPPTRSKERTGMTDKDDTVSLAEHQALWQRAQNVEQRERELLKELEKLRGELAEAQADSKAPAWDQYHGAVARASDLQITNKNLFEECERLNKRIDELEGISNGLRKELAEQKNDALNEYYVDIERVAKLESALKAENERLKEANAKRANYKREVRRLQDVLARQRGQHRWVEIERLEQRVQALEGKEGHARLLRDAFASCAEPKDAEGAESKLQELERRIVRNAGRVSLKSKPRWAHVLDVTAHGSTVSSDMCRRHGVDPDEMIGGEGGE